MTTIKDATFPVFTGGKERSLSQRLDEFGAVNVAEMDGFVGNGIADDLMPLRAAVAKALEDNKGSIFIPPGARCAVSDTLFVGFEEDQLNPAFSMGIVSSDGPHGNHNAQGAYIVPMESFKDGTVLLLGPGQEMLAQNIAVIDTNGLYRGLMDPEKIGIGISGGPGGASGWRLSNCHVYGMHTAVKAGVVSESLCDSGVMDKLNIDQCAVGVQFISTQNYIQSLIGCTITATTAVSAILGHNVTIIGGNYSSSSGRSSVYTLADVSTLTNEGAYSYTFTAEITDPDASLEGGLFTDGAMNLPQFGIVPVTMTDYDAGTQIATFELLPMWIMTSFYDIDVTTTNFDTINQANTYMAMAERLTMLHGTGFNVHNIHMENAAGYSRLLEAHAGFDAGSHITHIDGLFCNYDPAIPFDSDPDLQIAKRLLQKSHPFINLISGGLILDNSRFSQASNVSLTIDSINGQMLEVNNWRSLRAPNVRYTIGQNPFTGGSFENYGGAGVGGGIWTPTPFTPITLTSEASIRQRQNGWNKTEYWGWFPGKDRTPRLAPSQVTTLDGGIPTFETDSNLGYVPLCGGTLYSIGSETQSNVGADLFLRSNHKGFSLGQNLTTTNIDNLAWSFYGKTNKLVVNVEAFQRLHPGMVLSLSHASISSGTPFEVIITGMFYEELYVTVMAFSGIILPGTNGTQYTGTTIGQAAYSITTI